MAAVVIACLEFCKPRRAVFLAICAAALLVCAASSLRLVSREDIRALIPETAPALAEQFAAIRNAPFLHTLTITVGGDGLAPESLADALADALAGPGTSFVATGPGNVPGNGDLARFTNCLPSLLAPANIAAVAATLREDGIRAALEKDKQLLLGPSGPALRALTAKDPLRLHEAFFKSLEPMRGARQLPTRNGYFVDPTGRYGLVIVKPEAAMTDSGASAAVTAKAREAIAKLPSGAEAFAVGSYIHSAANAAVIKGDLSRVLPASLFLIAALFLLFLRSRRALTILLVPGAALCVASIATTAVFGSVSGIVLGFGSVILGITADYAIHSYYAISGSRSMAEGITRLCPPLFGGACTTSFAFAALLFSDIPAMRQIGSFGLFGVGAALVFSLLVLPHLLRSLGDTEAAAEEARPTRFRAVAVLGVTGFLLLIVAVTGKGLRLDGDIRNLSYASPEIRANEERSRAIWGMPSETSFIAASGDATQEGFDAALRINARVWDVLRKAGFPATGIAPFLPPRDAQAQSREAWKRLWAERGAETTALLGRIAPDLGFAPSAFDPFTRWITEEPEAAAVTPETLRDLGFGFFSAMFTGRTESRSFAYTMPGDADLPPAVARAIAETGATTVSGKSFRDAMAQGVGDDIFRFSLLTVAAVIFAVAILFRSPLRILAVLLPMLAGLAFTLVFFHLAGIRVNMFHAVALPLVIALSVDYGIFMQAVIEGRMDGHGKKGVLLSALTTLAGFGSLLLARHPALFSLGLAVTGGIAAAMAAALWLQPLLVLPPSLSEPGARQS